MVELAGFMYGGKGRARSKGLSVCVLDSWDNFKLLGQWRSEDCKLNLPQADKHRITRMRAQRFALILGGLEEIHRDCG